MAGRPDTDNLDHDQHFSPVRACNAAKLENILFTRELHRRHHAQGISAAAFHPGNVATGFATESDSRLMKFFATNPVTRAMLISPEKGAHQLAWLAEGQPGADWESGTYYEKHKPARRLNPQALDTSLARNLWERSEQLISAVYSR